MKQILLLISALLLGNTALQAQCKQDSLFLKGMISNPKLIEADFLKQVQEQLVGKTLYVKSACWWQYNENYKYANRKLTQITENTGKYCAVTITRIVNDYDDKYIVMFQRNGDQQEYCFGNVVFNYNEMGSFLNFDTYFTFENPKIHYPKISNKQWEQIISQKITKGFTPEEVQITFGKPDRTFTENELETWVYYNYCKRDYAITFKKGVVEDVLSQSVR